jgi:hypothetical protein
MEPYTHVQNPSRARLIMLFSFILAVLIIALASTVGFYVYKDVNRYNRVKSTVDSRKLETAGYKKVDAVGIHIYVPVKWQKPDESKNVYSDIAFGSDLQITDQKRELGHLTPKLCEAIAKEEVAGSEKVALQNTTQKVEKIGDYPGCLIESRFSAETKEYSVRKFIIFRKETMFTVTHTFQNRSEIERENSDTMLKSISIDI